jgi:class 3 adenylate cyclase
MSERISNLRGGSTAPPPSSPLVGRAREVARLRGHLEAARNGTPQAVFIEGDAGVGKSRLLRATQREASTSGFEVLPCRCLEHFELPYQPFRSTLLPRLTAAARGHPDLVPFATLVDRAVDAPSGNVLLDGSGLTADHARVLHAIAAVALGWAREQPLLVTVDDLQWADGPSLDLLLQLVFETSDASIAGDVSLCIVGSYRAQPPERLRRDLARMLREEICHRVEVGPLDEVAATQLVRDLGLERASRQLVETVLRASGGNPLLLESAVPQLLNGRVREEGGELVPVGSLEDLAVPDELADAVTDRLRMLDGEIRELLTIAAVAGDEFTRAELSAYAGVAEHAVADAVAVAIEHDVLTAEQDHLMFAHPMFARVLRRATTSDRREAIHVAVARALATSPSSDDVTLTVGWHLAEAGASAEPTEALAACRAAGERSWQLAAWAEAARYFDAAAAAAQRGREPAAVVAPLLARAGAAHCRNLDPGPGGARLRQAIQNYDDADDLLGAVGSWIELVHVQVAWGRFGQPIDMSPLEALLPKIETTDVVLCARGYAQLAEGAWPQGRVSATERYAERALALVARADDANARTRAHLARAQARWLRLDLGGALEALHAAHEAGRGSGNPWLVGLALPRLALNLFWLGRVDDAQHCADAARAAAQKLGNFAEESLALAVLTCIAVARGEFDAAEELGDAAVAAIRLSRYTWSASLVFPALVTARLWQGDVLGARSAIDQWNATVTSIDDSAYVGTIEIVELLVDMYADETDRVRRALLAAPHLAAGEQAVFVGGIQRVAALVELATVVPSTDAFAGWSAAVQQALDAGMRIAEGLVLFLPRVMADLAALRGSTAEAAAAYRDAIADAEAARCAPEKARAQLGYARLIHADDLAAALAAAQSAAESFAELAMPDFELEARAFVASVSISETPTRDTVVLVFTDVVDSTRLTEELGDEAYFVRAAGLDEELRRSIAECGGQPEDGIRPGDGLLASFTCVEQALRCAAFAHHHADANGLELHIGVHIGEVIVTRTGIHGGSVNLAARVCQTAPPGVTLTSGALRYADGAETVATFEDFGVHRLKGIAEPQHLFVAHHLPAT